MVVQYMLKPYAGVTELRTMVRYIANVSIRSVSLLSIKKFDKGQLDVKVLIPLFGYFRWVY